MKKIMGMMLGLSLLMGTVALFADDAKPAADKKAATTKTKKKGKKKKEAAPATEKK